MTPIAYDRVHSRLVEHSAGHAVLAGQPFDLKKGGKSNYYVKAGLATNTGFGTYLVGSALWHNIEPFDPDYIIGMQRGADPLVAAVLAELYRLNSPKVHTLIGLSMRKPESTPKTHGIVGLFDGVDGTWSPKGKRGVVVEDTTTTGDSALMVVNQLLELGGDVAGVVTLYDREEGAAKAFSDRNLPFVSVVKVRSTPALFPAGFKPRTEMPDGTVYE